MESKYGESVSVKDISGKNPVKKKRGKPPVDATTAPATVEHPSTAVPGAAGGDGEDTESVTRHASVRRKAPTDSTNLAFEEWLRGRRPRDFLAEQVSRLLANGSFKQDVAIGKRKAKGSVARGAWHAAWCRVQVVYKSF